MFGFDLNHLAAFGLLAAGAIGLLYTNRQSLLALVPKIGTTSSAPPDDDAADFQALTRLQKRYVRMNCPEGKAAVQVCLAHFYHEA